MTFDLIIKPEAERDLAEALAWYERQRPGLGKRFVAAHDVTIATIRRNPAAFRDIYKGVRRAPIRRFPYGVYFFIDGSMVFVIAVTHGRRHSRH